MERSNIVGAMRVRHACKTFGPYPTSPTEQLVRSAAPTPVLLLSSCVVGSAMDAPVEARAPGPGTGASAEPEDPFRIVGFVSPRVRPD